MKAIAVINEMPKDCDECPLVDENCYCILLGKDAFPNECVESAPYYSLKEKGNCPLRPLPEKMPMRDEAEFYLGYMNGKTKYLGFNEGYNACLEDILGGE